MAAEVARNDTGAGSTEGGASAGAGYGAGAGSSPHATPRHNMGIIADAVAAMSARASVHDGSQDLYPHICVAGEPGAGKSTLLNQWLLLSNKEEPAWKFRAGTAASVTRTLSTMPLQWGSKVLLFDCPGTDCVGSVKVVNRLTKLYKGVFKLDKTPDNCDRWAERGTYTSFRPYVRSAMADAFVFVVSIHTKLRPVNPEHRIVNNMLNTGAEPLKAYFNVLRALPEQVASNCDGMPLILIVTHWTETFALLRGAQPKLTEDQAKKLVEGAFAFNATFFIDTNQETMATATTCQRAIRSALEVGQHQIRKRIRIHPKAWQWFTKHE